MKRAWAAAAAALWAGQAFAQAPALPAGYRQVWFYDFPGTTLDRSVFPVLYGGPSVNRYFLWDHSDVSQNNGLTISFVKKNGVWTTGGVDMKPNGTIYGLFEFYAKLDHPKQGVGPVLLLWACNNQWPPEIDVLEAPDGHQQAFQTVHYGTAAQNLQISTPTRVDPTQWHDYAVDWEPAGISYYIDGHITASIPAQNGNDPKQCMAVGISGYIANPGDGWYGSPPADDTPDSFTVKWVRISKSPCSSPAFAVASSGGTPTTLSAGTSLQQAEADAGISIPPPGAPIMPSPSDMSGAGAQERADLASAARTGHQVTPADVARVAAQANTVLAQASAADQAANAATMQATSPTPTAIQPVSALGQDGAAACVASGRGATTYGSGATIASPR